MIFFSCDILSDFDFIKSILLGGLLKSWRRKWQPTPAFLPGKSHGGRSLLGYSPWGRKESDTTEQLHFTHKILSSGTVCVEKCLPQMFGCICQ